MLQRFYEIILIVWLSIPALFSAPVSWTGGQNVDINGNAVEKTSGGSDWNAGAYSVEAIASGDFYIEFIATETNKHRFIGFTDLPIGTVFNNLDGALFLHNAGNVQVYRNGSFRANLGAFVANTTRLRIQVNGANIEYYVDDVLQFTETTTTITYPLHVDVSINNPGGTFSNVDFDAGEPVRKPDIVSFRAADPDGKDDAISAGDTLSITFSEATDQAGLSGLLTQSLVDSLFSFTHSIGSGYTGSWVNNSLFSVTIATPPANLPRFATKVTPQTSPFPILPAAGGSPADEQSAPLQGNFGGENVLWGDITNASAAGNTLSKTNGTQQFLSGGASSRTFYEKDAWVEMTAVLTNHMRLIGFTSVQNPLASADLTFAVAFSDNGQVLSFANGNFTTPSPTITYSPGDIIRVAIEGDDVRFYHNDVAFRTLSLGGVAPYPLRAGGVLGYSGADCAIDNARRSIPTPIIASFWADDPDNEDGWLSAGDTMELTFTAPTNQPPSGPGVLPASEVDALFTFTHDLGDDYAGEWVNPSIFRVTLLAPTTLVPRFQATVTPTAAPGYEILNVGDKGLPSTTTSIPLDGDWGSVIVTWTNLTNATADGNDIIKDNLLQYQSGGVSTEQFEGGEPWIEGTADVLGNFRMFGFTTNDFPSEPHHLTWAIGFGESGDIVIYEDGNDFPPTVPTTFKEGDVARIAVESGYIVYYLESYEIHRTALSAPLPFPMRYGAVLGYFQNIASIRNARHSVATPIIQEFRANDSDDGDDVYSVGDSYDIRFDRPTDQSGTVNKAGVDAFFTFHNPALPVDIPVSIGTDYAGEWISKSIFRITVSAIDGSENVTRFVTIAQPNLQGDPIYLEGKTIGRASIPSAELQGDFGGQDVVWSTAPGILRGNPTIDGNTITKTSGPQWSQGSQSIQEFLSGDVWVEAWAPDSINNAVTFGLAIDAPINQPYSPDYGICFCPNGVIRVYDDNSGTPAYTWDGTYNAGDTARVEVIDGIVKYFIRATELPYTSAITAANYPLYGEASLGYSDGASVIYTRLSYPIPTIYKVVADDPDDMDDRISAGDTVAMLFTIPTNQYGTPDQTGTLPKSEVDSLFSFSHTIGADYVGSWTTPSVFTVTIADATGTDLTRFHTIIDPFSTNIRNAGSSSRPSNTISPPIWGDFGGRRVDWQQLVNATAGGIHSNDIVRNGSLAAWNAGGTSEGDFEVLYGPVYVETVVRETNASKALGLGKTNSNTDISDIEYAMFLDGQGRIFSSVSGTLSGSPIGTYSFEDIVRVAFEYDGSQANVRWYNNDVLLHEMLNVSISHLYPVTVDAALYAAGATFYDVKTNWPCPVAFDDAYVSDEDTPAQENVWDNDFHYGSGLSYVDTPPSTGILTLSTRGAFVYDPDGQFESMQEGESTSVTFTYYLDNSRCTVDGATVVITINGANDCPIAGSDATSTTEDSSVAGNVAGNDSDIEGDPLTFSAGTPGSGLITVAPNGDFSYDPNGAYDLLNLGETATDRFTYLVNDGRCTTIGQVLVIIHGANDCPIVTADTISMDEDTGGTGNVLANDFDPEGNPVSASQLTSPSGSLTFLPDGSFTYGTSGQFNDLALGETATDSFTYLLTDGACSAVGTVVLVIHGGNDCPAGLADSASTDQDTATAGNVLTNDSDPDGDSLTAELIPVSPSPCYAESFAILAGSTVTVAGTGTVITGNVGVSPGTSITGIPAGAALTPPSATHSNTAAAIAEQAASEALYTTLRDTGGATAIAAELGGTTLTPGTYSFSSSANIADGTTLTLDGAGVYIFKVGSAITANVHSSVILLNGASPSQVFWQVTSAATLNGVTFSGTVV
ncbi:MAG: VCBS repeat-containing protein, partial [Rhodothermales bacterium]